MKDAFFSLLAVGFFLGLLVGIPASNLLTHSKWEKQVISRGLARFEANPQTGEVSFKWIDANTGKEVEP